MPPARPGTQGVFQIFHAGQVLDDEVRVAPKLVPLIQILQPVVRQLDAGYAGHQGDRCTAAMDQSRSVRRADDEGAEAIEESGTPGAYGTRAQRQDQQQRRQQRHGIHEGA